MKTRWAFCLGLGAALLLLLGGMADARVYRLRRLVVVGDSLVAGFGSGGLVARGATGQRYSSPALIARQARVPLAQPLMSRPGVPPPLRLDDKNGNGVLEPGEVDRSSDSVGFRSSTSTVARNLAVPGEDVQSVFETIDAAGIAAQIAGGGVMGRDLLKFLILGVPLRDQAVSQLNRARALRPTFILVWLGNNDVLPMATHTDPAAVTLTSEAFGVKYRDFLGRLADTGADMAVANLPDVTHVPALRHAAGDVTGCRRADGTVIPITPDALVSIGLDPATLPTPPCNRVLTPDERAQVRATVAAFNARIASAVADVEQTRGIAIAQVDAFALFDDIATNGYRIAGPDSAAGVFVLDTQYLGGLFSLDGDHPTRTGQAVIANAFIGAINARFGESIPSVDLRAVAKTDPFVNNPLRPRGEPPFRLINDRTIDIQDALNDGLGHVADQVSHVIRDLKHRVRDVLHRLKRIF